jgi:hypothetical protein
MSTSAGYSKLQPPLRSQWPSDMASGSGGDLRPTQDVVDYLKSYARERPEVAALWCFGLGFILGWKLKPW